MMNDHTPIERLSKADITALFKRQQVFAPKVARSTYRERRDKLRRMQEYLMRHSGEIEEAAYSDMKKPPGEVRLSEIFVLTSELKYHLKHLARWMKPHRVSTPLSAIGTRGYIRYEPKGTTLIISPWNYPLTLALKPLISAVSAGCTVILKPSEFAPATSAFVRGLVRNIFDPEEVCVVEGDKAVVTDLLTLRFDHIFFTGSPAIGKIVMAAASVHLTSVSLELGGKSPCFVDRTADIPNAARQIAWSKFLNNGQTCIAPDYVLVEKSVRGLFLDELGKAIQTMYNAENKGIRQSPDYGRIIHTAHFEKLLSLYSDAIQKGANKVCGGSHDKAELFFEPTVLETADLSMAIMQEEIFGPILPVITYDTIEEALSIVHSREKPLALYIHSRSKASTEYILTHTQSGNALVNETLTQFQHAEIPFGGTGNSGMGKANGFFGFKEFSNPKGIIERRFGSIRLLYPPYSATTGKILKLMQRWL